MSVCKNLRSFTRRHEYIADFFSLLAVGLLFAAVWGILHYYALLSEWLKADILFHAPIAAIGGIGYIVLIFFLLALGSSRSTTDDERCFGTFKGRLHGAPSLGSAFRNWIEHIEHVGKRHR